MTKIIFRLLLILIIVINALIVLLSTVSGVNIYEKYRNQLLLGISIFCGLVIAFYISLALLGIN